MSRTVLVGSLLLFVLVGCRKPAPSTAPPSTGEQLLADLRVKFDAVGMPDETTGYDLRQTSNQASLAAALKPYDAAMDEAAQLAHMSSYGAPFVSAKEMAGEPDTTTDTAAQKQADARIAFVHKLARMLCARARLELVQAKSDDAARDLSAVASLAQLTGKNPGSDLGYLVHLSTVALIERTLGSVVQDTVLDAGDFRRLETIVTHLEDRPDWVSILQAEVAAEKGLKYAHTTAGKHDLADWSRLIGMVKTTASIAALDRRLRSEVGNGALPSDLSGLRKAKNGLLFASMLETEMREAAELRMRAMEFALLAANDKNGSFPPSPPKTYNATDPFSSGGSKLVYARTPNGFTITAPGSRGAVHTAHAPTVVSLQYPPTSYLPARL